MSALRTLTFDHGQKSVGIVSFVVMPLGLDRRTEVWSYGIGRGCELVGSITD